MKFFKSHLLVLLLVSIAGTTVSRAQTIVDTFPGNVDAGPGYTLIFDHNDGGDSIAGLFVNSAGNITPTTVEFMIGADDFGGGGSLMAELDLNLYSDSTSSPGTIDSSPIWTQHYSDLLADGDLVIPSVAMIGAPTLVNGASYWFEIVSNSVWDYSGISGDINVHIDGITMGPIAQSFSGDPGNFTYSDPDFMPAFRLNAVPEPSTYALIFGSISLSVVVIWKRRRNHLDSLKS